MSDQWKDQQQQHDRGEEERGSKSDTPFGPLTQHDVPVDIIVTPTRIIRVPNRLPKPSGIFWELLSPQKLGQIRVLQELKRRLEDERKEALPCGPDEILPPVAERGRRGGGNSRVGNGGRFVRSGRGKMGGSGGRGSK